MALIISDRVKETTNTTGTGTYTLAGALPSYESFAAIGNGNTTYYACTDGTDWEVGIGTYTASGTTLARTTILQSSNSDAAVNWGSGIKTIFCTLPADKYVFKDADGDVSIADDLYVSNQIIHTGDTDTYIGFSSDDTWQVVTGNSSAIIANNSTVTLGRDINSSHDAVFTGNVDAAQFRSQADTGYYLDPDGDSVLSNITLETLNLTSDDTASKHLTLTNDTGPNLTVQVYGTGSSTLTIENASTSTDLLSLTDAGNLTVAGTVEGRNLVNDGAKLDNIESGATADQTASEIKTAYESNADTNAFTDTLLTKLNNIEANATADQTKEDIDALGIDADQLDGQEGTYYLDYTNFTNTPTIPTDNSELANGAGYITSADGGNAATLDGIDSTSFLRSDANDTGTKLTLETLNLTSDDTASKHLTLTNDTGPNLTVQVYGSGSSTLTIENASTSTDLLSLTDAGNLTVAGTVEGRNLVNDGAKLDLIEAGATADQTKADIDALGINADQLDGQEGTYYLDYTNFTNTPTIPTNNNQLTNGAGYITSADGGNADQLDGQEGTYYLDYNNFTNTPTIPTVPTNVSAFTNDAGYITSADGGNADQLDGQEGTYYLNYNNFTNTPTIPTNNNQLTNGAGYITNTLTSTDAGATAGPTLELYRNSASPATSDLMGEIRFEGEDYDGTKVLNGRMYSAYGSITSGSRRPEVFITAGYRVSSVETSVELLKGSAGGVSLFNDKLVIDSNGPSTPNNLQVDGTLQVDSFIKTDLILGSTDVTKGIGLTSTGSSSLHNLSLSGDLSITGNTTLEASLRANQKNITSSATTVINLNEANHFVITMTQNTTLSLSNIATNIGSSGNIVFIQNATGGYSFTLDSNMKTPVNGATIVQSTGANEISILSYHVLSSNQVLVNYIGDFA